MVTKVAETPPLPQGDLGALVAALYRHFIVLGKRVNGLLPEDGTEKMTAPLPLKSYTVVGVPLATKYEGALIYVSNETGGKTVAFSDGTNWRRVQDRVIIA